MKKLHHKSLKLHTIFSAVIAVALLATLGIARDASFAVVAIIALVYITGNGIIHAKYNVLTRDTVIEYVLVAVIVIVLLVGSFLR